MHLLNLADQPTSATLRYESYRSRNGKRQKLLDCCPVSEIVLLDQLDIYTPDHQEARFRTQWICEQIARCLPDRCCNRCSNAHCLRTLPYTCFALSSSTGTRHMQCIWCDSYRKRFTKYFRTQLAYVDPIDLLLPGDRSDLHDPTWFQWEQELVLLRQQYNELTLLQPILYIIIIWKFQF